MKPDLPRYRVDGWLDAGGMGELWCVHDRRLDCPLVLKVLGAEPSPAATARFLREAHVTARLQHPGIAPVHDIGKLPDGRPYFTMRRVEGPRLRDAFAEDWPLPRLVDVLRRVADTVGFAHARGVVHRDLKPENVMVGEHGEVLVLDWGIARILGTDDIPGAPQEVTHLTMAGTVLGTLRYMAPEQTRGEPVGPAADVYAIGLQLWEALTGAPQVPSSPTPRADPVLEAVAQRATAADPEARFPDAHVLAQALAEWLDRAAAREQALRIVDRANAALVEAERMRGEAARLRDAAGVAGTHVHPLDPVEGKRAVWALEDAAAAAGTAARNVENEALQLLEASLTRCADLPEAHDAIAEVSQRRQANAEAAGDEEGAAEHAARLRAHDRGRFRRWMQGTGAVTLVTDPPGARVRLFRWEEVDRRLVPVDAGALGCTPLDAVPLAMGSWLLVIEADGRAPVRYPVFLRRGEHWSGVAPGGRMPSTIVLPPTLDPEEAYVPAGPFWSGGDPEAIFSLPRERLWVDGFVARRFPVRFSEYLVFLDALDPTAAAAHLPRSARPACARAPDGRFVGVPDAEGDTWRPDWPVAHVTWADAVAFARWEAARTGLPWRLPGELEWEKAARGVDGRLYPWGRALDATFSASRDSRVGRPLPSPVGAYPSDEGPYGARDFAGGVRTWCADVFHRDGPPRSDGRVAPPTLEGGSDFRSNRGGSWTAHPRGGRCARRNWNEGTVRQGDLGIRLVRSL